MTLPATRTRPPATALPRTRRFRVRKGDIYALWAGQTVSMFGDEITAVALPTIALLVLHVSAFQFGLIAASSYLPYPVLGLLAGAWIDRTRRRAVLMIADLVRGAAIVSIPLAVLVHRISMDQLVAVGLIVGTASVFFNSAYQAYLPHIVIRKDLNKANARLSVSETASQVAGPTMAGGLITLIGPGGAMFADAASFLVSVISLIFIRRPEMKPDRRRGSLLPDVRDGLRLVIRSRLLLGLTLTSAVSNLGRGMALELVVLFAYRGLHLPTAVVGAMLAAGNAGPFLGSLASQGLTARLGLGPTLLMGSVMKGLPWVFMPLALFGRAGIPVVVAIMVVSGFFIPISNTNMVTIRQSLVSPDMQGRVAATVRTVTRTAVPVATILGGALAQLGTNVLGPRAGLTGVLALGGLIWLSAGLLLPRRMLRRVHSIDDLDSVRPTLPGADQRQDGDGTGRDARRLPRIESVLLADEPYRPMRPYRPMQVIDPAVLSGHLAAAYPGQNPLLPPQRAVRRAPAPPAPGPAGPDVREVRNPARQEPHPTTPNRQIPHLPASGPAALHYEEPHPTTPNRQIPYPPTPRPPVPGPDPAWPGTGQSIWEMQDDARLGPDRQGPASRRPPAQAVPGRAADDLTEAGQGPYRHGTGRTAPGRRGTWRP
jgi:MFS family permease